ncbi:MAG: LuxR family transcriptional regulator [Sphaerobacteraceae bacterium]|nr:MAG: LuxR family transcriptional regulator [Sphaerobacteraceae bacterium]
MSQAILTTKLYVPLPQPGVVHRPHLTARLNEGLHRKLTLISAPAGFGKTTTVREWISGCDRDGAWLSLDEGDSDPTRFLTYLIAALQTIDASIGQGVLRSLQSPRPPTPETILTALLNEIAALPAPFVLVLDDFHTIISQDVQKAVSFLIEHIPPQMHLVITTREDPQIPLPRLRARGQLTELRASDLRFSSGEIDEFLNQVMNLNLSGGDIAVLEARTEGWIAGLQLAALSMQGRDDVAGFISSFTGSHRFVLDYLVEEVLQQQPEHVQEFLLRTSILDRMCGPLCDAVMADSATTSQETLEFLEHANLFIVPLDNDRRWYRYHHLFAELLRQQLKQSAVRSPDDKHLGVAELNARASEWYEHEGLDIEAFQHAAAAGDIERAERLIMGNGVPLHFRGAVTPVLNWLKSLPTTVLDERPSLWVTFASATSMAGDLAAVEPKLQAAEAALAGVQLDDEARDLIGHIAANRALLATFRHDLETNISELRRALEYLHPNNLAVRTAVTWQLGLAHQLRGDRVSANQAFVEAVAACESTGNRHINIFASTGLGNMQEFDNQLHLAAKTYRRVLDLVGDPPGPTACEAHAGLARIHYQWNDVTTAEHHAQLSVPLARQVETIDSFVSCELFLARLMLFRGDVAGATTLLAKTRESAGRLGYMHRMPGIAEVQALVFLHEGNLAAAEHLAQTYDIPTSHARVCLAQGNSSTALEILESFRHKVEALNWADELLRVLVLQSVAHARHGEDTRALELLGDALTLAEPEGFIRIFLDEGAPIQQLLTRANELGILPNYTARLLAAFEAEGLKTRNESPVNAEEPAQPLIEPLSQRELEVLRLVAEGLSNREISERLFVALNTVKGHNRVIFGKLQVQRRTEAIARARELKLL